MNVLKERAAIFIEFAISSSVCGVARADIVAPHAVSVMTRKPASFGLIFRASGEMHLSPFKPELSASVQGESWDCGFESGTRRAKPYVVLIVSGATVSSSDSDQDVVPKEYRLYSCGSLILHV